MPFRGWPVSISLPSFITWISAISLAAAARNKTVLNGDTSIIYSPSIGANAWQKWPYPGCLDSTGGMWTTSLGGATITYRFNGTALYVYGQFDHETSIPVYTVDVDGDLTTLGQTPIPHSQRCNPIYSKTGLTPSMHTVVFTLTGDRPSSVKDLAFDGFVYTIPDPGDDTSVPPSQSNDKGSGKVNVALIGGIAAAVVAVLLIILALFIRRRRANATKKPQVQSNNIGPTMEQTPVGPGPVPAPAFYGQAPYNNPQYGKTPYSDIGYSNVSYNTASPPNAPYNPLPSPYATSMAPSLPWNTNDKNQYPASPMSPWNPMLQQPSSQVPLLAPGVSPSTSSPSSPPPLSFAGQSSGPSVMSYDPMARNQDSPLTMIATSTVSDDYSYRPPRNQDSPPTIVTSPSPSNNEYSYRPPPPTTALSPNEVDMIVERVTAAVRAEQAGSIPPGKAVYSPVDTRGDSQPKPQSSNPSQSNPPQPHARNESAGAFPDVAPPTYQERTS